MIDSTVNKEVHFYDKVPFFLMKLGDEFYYRVHENLLVAYKYMSTFCKMYEDQSSMSYKNFVHHC